MSEFERHRRACAGKSHYATHDVAHKALSRMIGTGRGGDTSLMRVYQCLYCNTYHFGHNGGKRMNDISGRSD